MGGSQIRVAEATMEIESAHRLMQQKVAALLEQGARQQSLTVEERLHSRSIHTYVSTLCVRAVDRLWRLLDSRVVDVPMAYGPRLVRLSSLKPVFFQSLQHTLRFSDNTGASDPGIQ